MTTLSVIIVQYNNVHLTIQAIRSFRSHCGTDHQIILVDNNSSDPSVRTLERELPGVLVLRNPDNEGFSKGNNIGAEHAKGDILLFLNNDTITTSDFVTPVLDLFARNTNVGVAGPRLLNEDSSFQLSCGKLPSFGRELRDRILYGLVERKNPLAIRYAEWRMLKNLNVEWVTGAALFIRRELFQRLGGFDETMVMFFEDKDLCLRALRASNNVRFVSEASLVHLRGASNTEEMKPSVQAFYRRSQVYYYAKHRPLFEQRLLRLYLRLINKYPHE